MMKLEEYLRLPWTIARSERDDDGKYIVLQVEELPGFVVAAPTAAEADALFWDALEEFLRSYLEDGEEPPVPAAFRNVRRRFAAQRRQSVREVSMEKGRPRIDVPEARSYTNLESVVIGERQALTH